MARMLVGPGFLGVLLLSFAGRLLLAEETLVFGDPRELESELRIRLVLQQPLAVDFQNVPLRIVAEVLERQLSHPFSLDLRALEDAGAAADTPVTFRCDRLPARDALRQMLGALDLAWMNRGTIVITTPERQSSEMVTRVYPVADLVAMRGEDDNDIWLDYDSLIESVTTTTQPTTWDEVGGPGSIAPYPAAAALVVSQTREVHEEVETLLRSLRAARDQQGIPVIDAEAAWEAYGKSHSALRHTYDDRQQFLATESGAAASVPAWQRPRRHD